LFAYLFGVLRFINVYLFTFEIQVNPGDNSEYMLTWIFSLSFIYSVIDIQ